MKINIFFQRFLDVLFPEKCLYCRTKGASLCDSCVSYLPVAEPLSNDLYACLNYHHPVTREALWRLKYKKRTSLAHPFAKILLEHALELLSEIRNFDIGETDPFLVVAIPLSPTRLRERGYNQADLIAQELCAIAPRGTLAYAPSLLIKTKETPSQVTVKNRKERLKNLHSCFSVGDASASRGCDIIIIDDIITTGATMNEARRVLKDSGARRVLGLAVAH